MRKRCLRSLTVKTDTTHQFDCSDELRWDEAAGKMQVQIRERSDVRGRRQELSGIRIAPPQVQGNARSGTPVVPEVELRRGRGGGGDDGGRHFPGDATNGG